MTHADIMRLADAYAEAQRIAMIGGDIADITRARDALSLAVEEMEMKKAGNAK